MEYYPPPFQAEATLLFLTLKLLHLRYKFSIGMGRI